MRPGTLEAESGRLETAWWGRPIHKDIKPANILVNAASSGGELLHEGLLPGGLLEYVD
jgi:hypothetical protein